MNGHPKIKTRFESVQNVNLPIGINPEKVGVILLTKGKFAIVDAKDYEQFSKHKWFADKSGRSNTYYAERAFYTNGRKGKRFILLMHREMLGMVPGDGRMVDHKNRNGLDCRKEKLRETTYGLNNYNSKLRKTNTSGYRGVTWSKQNKKWTAQINFNNIHFNCGFYNDKINAAKAYDKVALKFYGDNAILNFPKEVVCR
jgi:hypothetical protein